MRLQLCQSVWLPTNEIERTKWFYLAITSLTQGDWKKAKKKYKKNKKNNKRLRAFRFKSFAPLLGHKTHNLLFVRILFLLDQLGRRVRCRMV